MGLVSSLKDFYNRITRSNLPRHSRIVYRPLSEAGVTVTPDTCLESAAVWSCVQILSKSVAQLPWRLMKETGPGSSQIMGKHPIDFLLNKRPNAEMGAFTFRETIMGHALTWGNGFAEIERSISGDPINLWLIEPDRVLIRRDPVTDRLFYQVTNQTAGVARIEPENMFHLHGPSYDGVTGYAVTQYSTQSIGLALAIERFGAAFFGNNGHLGGVISNPKADLSLEGREALLNTFNHKHQGPYQAFKVAYLDNGMTFQSIGVEPDKGQFIQSAQFQIQQICRLFGVPPHMIADLSKASFNNIEQQSIEFVRNGLTPWVIRLEQEADAKLINVRNPQGYYTYMNVRGLERGDLAARTAFYQNMFDRGVLSINDIRGMEGLNSIGPDGDIRLVPMNFRSLKNLDQHEQLEMQVMEKQAGPEPKAEHEPDDNLHSIANNDPEPDADDSDGDEAVTSDETDSEHGED